MTSYFHEKIAPYIVSQCLYDYCMCFMQDQFSRRRKEELGPTNFFVEVLVVLAEPFVKFKNF